MCNFDSIADVLTIALTDMSDNFAIVVSDWSRVRSIGSLLSATVVHFVCTIDADNYTEACRIKKLPTLQSQSLVELQV